MLAAVASTFLSAPALQTVVPVVAQAPWAAWRHRLFAIREIRVEGVRYLDPPAVKIGGDQGGGRTGNHRHLPGGAE